jgi:hypothetical protein
MGSENHTGIGFNDVLVDIISSNTGKVSNAINNNKKQKIKY